MNPTSAERVLESGERRPMNTAGPIGTFFKGFLKHPVMVGSIIPSSAKLIDHMLSRVNWQTCKVFVEYGPGVGTFCRPILSRMAPDATLIAIDTNPDFIDYLGNRITDPRFQPVLGSAADVGQILAERGHWHADYILSGLPFSTLPPGVGDQIARETAEALGADGTFLVYQFSPKVRDFLAPHFPKIDHAFELINIPPAQLYWASKG